MGVEAIMSAALHHQLSLASSAALSASDHDLAFHLQLSEAIQASLSSNAAAPSHPAPPPPPPEEPSDASCALAVHAADLARAEQDHRDAQACRAYHARAAASVRVAAHDALFARDLAAIPEDRWAHDGDYFERPLPLEGGGALFRVLFKGMASREVVGPRDRDPGVGVLAVAICGPRGEVVLRGGAARADDAGGDGAGGRPQCGARPRHPDPQRPH